MKKIVYILFPFFCIGFAAVSCSDSKSDDKTPPTIEAVAFNRNDTLWIDKKGNEILMINKDGDAGPDILVIGHRITLDAMLKDEESGLSSIVIRIWGDTLENQEDPEIAYKSRRVPQIRMYGNKEYEVVEELIEEIIPYKLKPRNPQNIEKGEFSVRESGDVNEYKASVYCIDIAGNENLDSYAEKEILILSRETVLTLNGYPPVVVPKPEAEKK